MVIVPTTVSRNVSEIELGAVVAPVTTLIYCIGFVHRVERKCEQSLDGPPVLLCSTLSCHSITWIWTSSLKYFQLLTITGPSMWLSDVHLDLITVKMSRNLKTSSAVFVSSTKLHNFHSAGSKQGWEPHLIFYFMWHSSLFDKGKLFKTRWALVFIVSGNYTAVVSKWKCTEFSFLSNWIFSFFSLFVFLSECMWPWRCRWTRREL